MRYFYFIFLSLIYYQSNSQSINILDIDSSEYPLIKATFYATDDRGKRIKNISLKDLTITENGEIRNIISVNCKEAIELDTVSNLLTFDISGSMAGENFQIAKEAAYNWVEELPLNIGECAVTSFSEENKLEQDFTNNKNLIKSAINNLEDIKDTTEGTSFDAAFINAQAGGLRILQNAPHKKIMILISDGDATGNQSLIINRAKNYDITVYCIIINAICPDILKSITYSTGGLYFDHITSVAEAREAFNDILHYSHQLTPCRIVWESDKFCETGLINVEMTYKNGSVGTFSYSPPEGSTSNLKLEPVGLSFIDEPLGIKTSSTIELSAIGSDYIINDIKTNNPDCDISPKSFTLDENETKVLTVSYTPQDSNFKSTEIDIDASPCSISFKTISYYSQYSNDKKFIEIQTPNGGEIFYAGTDTLIEWEGLKFNEPVDIKFSKDNGQNWTEISNHEQNLNYNWKIDKNINSNKCLVSVTHQKEGISEFEWYKTIGGNSFESIYSIDNTIDGGFIIASSTNSTDGQISNNHGKRDIWLVKTDLFGTIEWEKSYGGRGSDQAIDIKLTDDGGYILVGFTDSDDIPGTVLKGANDLWIVKLDFDGNIEWNKIFGGSNTDYPISVAPSIDGGYFILATTKSTDGDVPKSIGAFDLWLIKLSNSGTIEWQEVIGGSDNDQANEAKSTSDGGYILCGYSSSSDGDLNKNRGSSDAWVIKLDKSGNIEWNNTYGGSLFDSAKSIEETNDGGFIFLGSSSSIDGDVTSNYGANDIWVVKLNKTGVLEWQKSYGGSREDYPTSIKTSDNGDFMIFAYSWSDDGDLSKNNGLLDIWIFEIDNNGSLLWEQTLGGNFSDVLECCQKSVDNGFILGGSTNSTDGDFEESFGNTDNLLIKFSPDESIFLSDTSDNVFSIVIPRVTSNDIDFGKAIINSDTDSTFDSFIVNITNWPCRVDSVYFDGTDSQFFQLLNPQPVYTVPGRKDQSSKIRFSPKEVRHYEADVVIISQTDSLRRKIRGEGIEPALVIVNKEIDFGTVKVGTDKDTLSVITITNINNSSVDIINTEILGVNASDYSILNGAALFTLHSGDTCRMDLRYSPSNVGPSSAKLLFHFHSVDSPAQVNLRGTGISTNTVNISDVHFTDQLIGKSNDSIISTYFYNTGIYSNIVEEVFLKDGDFDQFEIKNLSLPFSIDANTGHNLEITFSPTSIGDKHTTLYMICQNDTITKKVDGRAIQKSFEIITSNIEYATIEVGQQIDSSRIAILRNTGTENLVISDILLTGTDLQDFIPGNGFQALILNSGDTLFVDLSFAPQTIGYKSVNISISHNHSATPELIRVTGEAIKSILPRISISIPNIVAETGETIYLPLILEESENMSKLVADGLIANISFNSYVMLPSDRTAEISGNIAKLTTDEFSIKRNVGDTLTLIPFKVMLGDKEISPIDFDKLIAKDDMLIIDTKSGSLKISDLCEQGGKRLVNPEGIVAISNLSPNPAETILQIDFSVIEKGTTTISLIDMLGKTVSILFDENISEFKDMKVIKDISHISAGYYIIQLQTLTYVERRKVLIVR